MHAAASKTPAGDGEATPPDRIGPYQVRGLLGVGGFGTVYLGEQMVPVRRLVAVKLMHRSDPRLLARFRREIDALLAMNHDAVARVLDAGDFEGRPFLVLEHIEGAITLDQWVREHTPPLDRRLRLFADLCAGVQHAHERGLLHRDLKPANVLVGLRDGAEFVKIIDFGLARAVAPAPGEALHLTQEGALLGTPGYMSPEQACGHRDIDTRSDVWSLGAILYDLLTGLPPHHAALQRARNDAEILRVLDEDEPAPPSRAAPPHSPIPIGTELDWIVQMALRRDREARYATPNELAADLVRLQRGEAVLAAPPSAMYRLRKLVARHRLAVATATVGGLALGVGAIATIADALEALDQAERTTVVAASLAQQTGEYNLLGHELRLRQLRNEVPGLLGRAGSGRDAEAWLERWAELRGIVPQLRTTLADLAAPEGALSRPGTDGDEAATRAYRRRTLGALADAIEQAEGTFVLQVRSHARFDAAEGRVCSGKYGPRWAAARAAVAAADGVTASTRYGYRRLDLQPQRGLVPIGMNPATGLWEFYDLRSAWDPNGRVELADVPIPEHDPQTGHISVGANTGIVFVLLPAETCWLGVQTSNPNAPLYAPRAEQWEPPPHQVEFGPLLVARHELSIGQWERLLGSARRSRHRPPQLQARQLEARPSNQVDPRLDLGNTVITELHPALVQADDPLLARLPDLWMRLPDDQEWERAARAGTVSRYFTGPDLESLRGYANMASDEMVEPLPWSWGRDGYGDVAPVDALLPNPNGLHHVFGNQSELVTCSPLLQACTALRIRLQGSNLVSVGMPDVLLGTGRYEPDCTRISTNLLMSGVRPVRELRP